MSKGDWTRPYDKDKFDENFEAIFGPRPLKTWDPTEEEPNGCTEPGEPGTDQECGGPHDP